MRYLLLSLAFILISTFSISQNKTTLTHEICTQQLIPLTASEEIQLRELPELTLPSVYRNRLLPSIVDNSLHPHFRPVFNQDEYCCGQAAGIAYNFTYEIDRARNLPADVPENQYPTHFAWNWLNSGYGYFGVSYLHSFQILKHFGMPNVVDYGGSLSQGGNDKWLSGYDKYYNGMQNRINNAYQIYVGSPEGLNVFKNWLFDHHEGSAIGGVGNYYAQYMSASAQLPAGTPEAGKYVLTYFGGSPNHAMTIVGYNDSIRYDYNSDGQYTNDIDINSDGVVDMKDWEIGGFKMAQSYGGVPGWGDQGFAYMMYKTVADDMGDGGIWNHCVHVLDVKADCAPQLTMKVVLEHDRRNTIKVTAGVSTNMSATQPEHVLDFPILDYQGGALYMQGGTGIPANKSIELGLDITPLLSELNPGQNAKFFLQVDEDDPGNEGTGKITSFSLMDYTNGVQEIQCLQSNVPLSENDITRLPIDAVINFDKVEIANSSLPAGQVGNYYSQQMLANNGATPYRWHLYRIYNETSSTGTFPAINQNQLSPSSNGNGFVTQQIDFEFPFYDSAYQDITVHVDGYLMFDEQLYPYPYFNDDKVLFNITRNISPFMSQELRIYPGMGDGIWYEGDANSATFRIKAHLDDQTSYEVDMAVTLYPSGNIEFYYDYINVPHNLLWIPGISDGDDETFQHTGDYNSTVPTLGQIVLLEPYDYPPELSLTEEGLFSGILQNSYNNVDITFRVTDNNFICNYKTLQLSTNGILIEDSISSGGDDIIEYGETALLSVDLTNIEGGPINNTTMSISTNDSLITITDSTEVIGILPVSTTVSFENAFSFDVDPGIPNNYPIEIQTQILGDRATWNSNLYYVCFAPEVALSDVVVADTSNGYLDPGEETDLLIRLVNNGGAAANNIVGILSCTDPYITINDDQDSIMILAPDSLEYCQFNISLSDQAPIGHIIDFDIIINADYAYSVQDSFSLEVGRTLENFETGDFSAFSWGFDGEKDWIISEISPYQGIYSARSGHISHDQKSSLMVDINVFSGGDLSFYRKVSCEDDGTNNDFDYLAFFIDDTEMGRWDGEMDWSEVSYTLSQGFHRLEWRYLKDGAVSAGFDGAWIDYISFPSCSDAYPALMYDPASVNMAMKPDQQDEVEFIMDNAGDGNINYKIWISSLPGNAGLADNRSILGSYLECDAEVVHAGEQHVITLTVYNTSEDSEWIRDINLVFPTEANLFSATNFTGGSADLIWDGATGSAAVTNWHGEDGSGWGVLKPGETATAEIVVFVEQDAINDISISFEVIGDIYGGEPHIISGDLVLVNLGPMISWISINSALGTIQGNSFLSNMIYFNSEGLADGEYQCELIINEQFQVVEVIPVTLLVDESLGTLELNMEEGLSIYPNPFNDQLRIEFELETAGTIRLEIYDAFGKLISVIADESVSSTAKHTYYWDGKDESGKKCPPGIYLIKLKDAQMNTHIRKAMFIY